MASKRLLTAIVLVCILLVADVVASVLVAAQPMMPPDLECNALYIAPREQIAVEPGTNGIRTKAQVYLRSQVVPGGAQEFTLQLFDSKNRVVVAEVIETLPVLSGGLEIVTVVDVKPEFLRVDPGEAQPYQVMANDPVYYFALIWENILDQLNFSDDPEQSDVGRVVVPTLYEVSQQYYSRADMFNFLVSRLTRIALSEEMETGSQVAAKAVSEWKSELDSLPRMIIVIRWQDQPFGQDDAYNDLRTTMATRLVPIVVVDIGQPIAGAESQETGNRQELFVRPLGPTPPQLGDSYPNPFDPTWDFARQYVARHVTNRTAATMEHAARPIRRRFDINTTWPVTISQEQGALLVLRVKAQLSGSGEELCSRTLVYPIAKSRSWTRRLAVLYAGALLMSGLTVASTTFLMITWLPVVLEPLKQAYVRFRQHTKDMSFRE